MSRLTQAGSLQFIHPLRSCGSFQRETVSPPPTNLATLQSAYSGWSSTKGGNVAEIFDMFDETVEMRAALSALLS